ncbi:MAG: DUF72 domain-containing protein [Candidatus Freyarchaeota archaeon]|nr:DUF72 domain-containing protein [Candidatus Jordarchaeia archaeon]
MLTKILVGCCGFPTGIKRYVKEFRVAEVQKTFYKPPSLETLRKWRVLAPENFEFTVKAWQVITHPPTSPTYKKAGLKLELSKAGFFRPTREVFEAWEKTREACDILKAKVCVFQTPSSFKENSENIGNMKEFFSSVDSGGATLAWEPRGWSMETVRSLCEELNLVHVTDPFASPPALERETSYFRLHGFPPGERLYRYKYTRDDLLYLAKKVREFKGSVYVLFNNIWMHDDATAFMRILEEQC